MKTVSLLDLVSNRVSQKQSKESSPIFLEYFKEPIVFSNKVNVISSDSRETSALGMFNLIIKFLERNERYRHVENIIYHLCLEENLENVGFYYLSHFGNEKLRNLKNKNYEVENTLAKFQMPKVQIVPIKNDASILEIQEIIDSLNKANNVIFIEGVDKVLSKTNRNKLFESLFKKYENSDFEATIVTSVKNDISDQSFSTVHVSKYLGNYLKYSFSEKEYIFYLDQDCLDFYPTCQGQYSKLSRFEIFTNNALTFKTKLLMGQFEPFESKNFYIEKKVHKIKNMIIISSKTIYYENNKLGLGRVKPKWKHTVLYLGENFKVEDYYEVMNLVQPEEVVSIITEKEKHIDPKCYQYLNHRVIATDLDKITAYAFEEHSIEKRKSINIPSPKLEVLNRESGLFRGHPGAKNKTNLKDVPPFLFQGMYSQVAVANFLMKYLTKTPNTHIYIAGIVDKSSYHLGDKNEKHKTFCAYNIDSCKRLIEYLQEEYHSRCEKYDEKVDPDKILYISSIDAVSSFINVDDTSELSSGFKLRDLMTNGKRFGIFVVASNKSLPEGWNSLNVTIERVKDGEILDDYNTED